LRNGLPTALEKARLALGSWAWVRDGLGWKLTLLPGSWLMSVDVLDALGRPAYHWNAPWGSRIQSLSWDGKGSHGQTLKAGRYLVVMRTSVGVVHTMITLP